MGAGFAGFTAARELQRYAPDADILLINPTDYFLYLPLLPEVGAGHPRTAPHLRVVAATATGGDGWRSARSPPSTSSDTGSTRSTPRDGTGRLEFDRLVLAAGSVNKLLPIPGVAEYAHGFRRHLRGVVPARSHHPAVGAGRSDRRRRTNATARCTFVVVGAGYTGTEVAAQGQLFTARLARQLTRGCASSGCAGCSLDLADRLLPGLSERLSKTADAGAAPSVGVEIRARDLRRPRPGRTACADDGSIVHPVADLVRRRAPGPTRRGARPCRRTGGGSRSHQTLEVPGPRRTCSPAVTAAAVPDLARARLVTANDRAARAAAGQARAPERRRLARAAGRSSPYKHNDLGFVVDLGGSRRPRTRCASRSPGSPPRRSPAATTSSRCRATEPARQPIGRSTRSCPRAQYSSGWSTRGGCRSTARVRLIDRASRARALSHPNCSRPVDLQANGR